jgi:signal transduction histidine kinase
MSDLGARLTAWGGNRLSAAEQRYDVILALALAVSGGLSALLYGAAQFYDDPAPVWVSALLVLAGALPLAVRRRWPLVIAVVAAAVFAATQILRVPDILVSNIELFIALYTAGAWAHNRLRAMLVRVVIIAAMFGWLFWLFATQGSMANTFLSDDPKGALVSPMVAFGLIQVFTNVLYFFGAYYLGERAWTATRQRDQLAQRTAELEAERERTGAQAVALERLRIARELHDVVAHHVSVMGVQAGAARRQLTRDPARAAEALGAVETSARDAVEELQQILTTLRDDDTESAAESPSTRGVGQLEPLAREAAATGLPTTFSIVGEPFPLPPTVDLSLYRIAQEAITNSLKHAGAGASADVRLRYLPGTVELEVTDDGVGARRGRGSRLGQLGMRERVGAVGGTIEFGPRERGGYLVRASIPVATP